MTLFVLLLALAFAGGSPVANPTILLWIEQLGDEHVEAVALATDGLLAHPDEAVPALEQALLQGPPCATWVRVLGQFRRPSSTPALRHALEVGDGPVTWEAAHALTWVDGPDARAALAENARSGTLFARKAAAAALAQPGAAWACDVLVAGLADADLDVRVGFANAALRAGCASAEAVRARAAQPENAPIRERLLRLLER